MTASATDRRREYRGSRDVLWGLLVLLSLVMLVNAVVTPLWRLLFADVSWVLLLLTPFNILLWASTLAGAWRRTSWGAPGRAGEGALQG